MHKYACSFFMMLLSFCLYADYTTPSAPVLSKPTMLTPAACPCSKNNGGVSHLGPSGEFICNDGSSWPGSKERFKCFYTECDDDKSNADNQPQSQATSLLSYQTTNQQTTQPADSNESTEVKCKTVKSDSAICKLPQLSLDELSLCGG